MVDPFAISVSFFFPLPPFFSEETTCLLSFCFLAVRKLLKTLLLPCHSIMLFGGRISWSHGKENCCPGSFILYSPYDFQNCIVPSQRGKIGLSCKSLVLFQAFVAFLKLLERILLSAEQGGGIAPDRLAPVILSLSCVLQLFLRSRHQAIPILSSQGFCCSCVFGAPNSAALFDLNRDLHRYESTQNLAHSLVCMQKCPCSFKLN